MNRTMAWTQVVGKKRGRHSWDGQHELAKNLLEALFARRPALSQERKPEWTCKQCKTTNFMTRKDCRYCSSKQKGSTTPPAAAAGRPTSGTAAAALVPKPAPWARAKAAASQAAALEAALEAARVAGGDERLIKELEGRLSQAQKASTDDRPMPDKLAGCRAYIARARQRLEKAEAAEREAVNHRENLAEDLKEHEDKLAQLERDAKGPHAATAMATDTPPAEADLQELQRQLEAANRAAAGAEQLRQQLRAVQAEATTLRGENESYLGSGQRLEAQHTALQKELEDIQAEQRKVNREGVELRALGKAALKSRLSACFKEHNAALLSESWAEVAALAETTQKLTTALRDAAD